MRMWCPHCGAEYVEGWGTCSTCGVKLVSEPPAQAAVDTEAWGRPRGRPNGRDDEDPFIPVWEGPTPEANALMRRIQSRHIPVELDDALEVGHARVQVPRSYLEDVRDVVLGLVPELPEISVETDDGLDWKPALKVAIAVTAIVLILLLVFFQ
jgi:hypothetical protein